MPASKLTPDIHPSGHVQTATLAKDSKVDVQKLEGLVEEGDLFQRAGQTDGMLRRLGASLTAINQAHEVRMGYENFKESKDSTAQATDVRIRKVSLKDGTAALAIYGKVPADQTKSESRQPKYRMTLIDLKTGAEVLKSDVHADGSISLRGNKVAYTNHRMPID